MINTNCVKGNLSNPIKWKDVKETLITQLMKSSGSERAVHELLTDCPADQDQYYQPKSITFYHDGAFEREGYPFTFKIIYCPSPINGLELGGVHQIT